MLYLEDLKITLSKVLAELFVSSLKESYIYDVLDKSCKE